MDKIYFQVIYIDAGYCVSSLKKFEDEIDILKYQLNDINKKYEEINKKYEEINKNYQEFNEKYESVLEILKKKKKYFNYFIKAWMDKLKNYIRK